MAYLTPTEVRAANGSRLNDPSTYPDDVLAGHVEAFEALAERYRGVAYTRRTRTELVAPSGGPLVLAWPMVHEVLEITDGGTDVDCGYTLDAEAGVLYGQFPRCHLTVVYEHGFETTPAAVRRACALYVWHEATADATPDQGNMLSIATDVGVERRATPDWAAGRPTGWMDVDRILNALDDYRTPGLA